MCFPIALFQFYLVSTHVKFLKLERAVELLVNLLQNFVNLLENGIVTGGEQTLGLSSFMPRQH